MINETHVSFAVEPNALPPKGMHIVVLGEAISEMHFIASDSADASRVRPSTTILAEQAQPISDDQKLHPVLVEAIKQLQEYFAKTRTTFSLPLAPQGTEFQKKVWQALTTIPLGTTWSYGDLAKAVGDANAQRAVGSANGKNPIVLVIPCHRVIAADRTLGGYTGGLPTKRWLLDHEAARYVVKNEHKRERQQESFL